MQTRRRRAPICFGPKGERPSVRMELRDITAYLRNRAEAPKDRMPKLPVKIRRKEKVL